MINMDNIKSVMIMLGFITTLTSTAFIIDNRYVHASEYNQLKTELEQTQELNESMLSDFMKKQRVQTLSDLIFDIQIKGELTPIDKARLDRYKRELDYIQRN